MRALQFNSEGVGKKKKKKKILKNFEVLKLLESHISTTVVMEQ